MPLHVSLLHDTFQRPSYNLNNCLKSNLKLQKMYKVCKAMRMSGDLIMRIVRPCEIVLSRKHRDYNQRDFILYWNSLNWILLPCPYHLGISV